MSNLVQALAEVRGKLRRARNEVQTYELLERQCVDALAQDGGVDLRKEQIEALQERLHALGHGVGDLADLDFENWSPETLDLVDALVAEIS